MKLGRILALLLLIVLSLTLLVSCSPVAELNVAIVLPNPPFSYRGEKQAIQGYDIEIAKALASAQGMTLRTVEMPFDEVLQAVVDGKVDCAVANITITPDRENLVAFSEPYFISGQVIVARSSSPIQSQESLNGQTVAMLGGSTAHTWATQNLAGSDLLTYGDPAMIINALKTNSAGAAIMDAATASYYTVNEKDADGNPLFHVVGEPLFRESIAVAVKKDNTDLLDKCNTMIHALATTTDESTGKVILENVVRQYLGELSASTLAEVTQPADTTIP